jgi:hypothetical protein
MPNFPQQSNYDELYPVETVIVQDFFMLHGYTARMELMSNETKFHNPETKSDIYVPRFKFLNKIQIEKLLNISGITLDIFEIYASGVKSTNVKFNMFIEQSLHTKPKKK